MLMRRGKATTSEAIQGSWKMAEVIRRYPQLIDELAAINPAFQALRSPITRRVQGSLVTVSQAARIAGLTEAELLRRLNAAIGIESAEAAEPLCDDSAATKAPVWTRSTPVAGEVDARPLQRAGEEPFSAIMAAIRQVPLGSALRLRSTFEPTPLYTLLAQRGFEHWAHRTAANDWEILFRHSAQPAGPAAEPRAETVAVPGDDWSTATATITIDVSELVPPEPLLRIMEALAELPGGASLLVHHVRRPIHLYARLDEEGYRHQTREQAPGHVEILIQKPAAR